jgi:hypothetical protein
MDAWPPGPLHVSSVDDPRYISSRKQIGLLAAGKQFVRHVVPAVIKPLRVLWNELIAFIFLAFGVMVAFSTYRNFTGGQAAGNPLVVLAGGAFAAMLFYFGLASLLRARKISRS